MEPPQERAGVWPADGGAQWQVGHKWAAEGAMRCAPLGSPEGRYPDGRRAGLLCFPTLGRVAAGRERPRHDYFRVAQKNALHLDVSAQTVAGSQRMTSQSQPAPPSRDAVVIQHGG